MPHVGMRPQSFSSSDKSRSFTARLKDKFRKHKSTENLHKASQQDFAPLSLPKQSHHQSQEFPFSQNGHNGLNGHSGHNGHNGDAMSLSSQGNLTYISRSSSKKKKSKSKKVIQSNGFNNGESSPEPAMHGNNQVNGVRPMTPQSNGGHSPETVSFTSNQFMQQPQMVQPQIYGQPTQPGAGYMLMPMAQPAQVSPGFMMVPTMPTMPVPAPTAGVPPGYMLVPMVPGMQQGMYQQQPSNMAPQHQHQIPGASASSSEDDAESIAYSEISSRSRSNQLKVAIPQDGNLYNFSIKKMAEFFRQMRLSDDTVRACIKDKVDGRKFSKLNEADLERYGLMHPLVIHFRRSTFKRRPNFML